MLQQARQNIITEEMKQVAKDEDLDPELIRIRIAEGKIVIPVNRKRKATKGLRYWRRTQNQGQRQRTGTSTDYPDVEKQDGKVAGSGRSEHRYGNGP